MKEQDLITEELRSALEKDALKRFPEEACGFISQGKYYPAPNLYPLPQEGFYIDPQRWSRFEKVDAVFHSHPVEPNFSYVAEASGAIGVPISRCEDLQAGLVPSVRDMEGQLNTNVPWVLVATDGLSCSSFASWGDALEPKPLLGRSFLHGIHDCYSLLRDWYRLERGICLKDFPRAESWWEKGEDLYQDHFKEAGFKEASLKEADVGTVFLFSVLSSVPNHAGVYLGDGTFLHHLQGRLSCAEPLSRWKNRLEKVLIYAG